MWTKTEEGTNKGTCHSQWPERIGTASDEVENNLFSGDEKKGKLTVFQLHLQHKLLLSEKLTVYIAQKQSSLKFTRLYCECRCVFLQKFPSATKSIKKIIMLFQQDSFPCYILLSVIFIYFLTLFPPALQITLHHYFWSVWGPGVFLVVFFKAGSGAKPTNKEPNVSAFVAVTLTEYLIRQIREQWFCELGCFSFRDC